MAARPAAPTRGDPQASRRSAGSSSSSRSSSTCTRGRARSSIPAANLDDLVTDGAGFAGFAAGEIGQVPSDPDIAAIPDLDELHARAVAAEPRPLRLRRHGRGRGVAVLPAHDPARVARRARASRATSSRSGSSSSTSSSSCSDDGSIEIADKLDTLEKPCYDMAGPDAPLRLPDDGLAVLQRARLGQLRERPRGRERPVRAELRRTTTRSRPATARSSSATWCTRSPSEGTGMIATFMPKPFTNLTGNGCHFHMSLWKTATERLPRRGRPARARPLRDRLPLHRRPEGARARLQRR